jgi:hypothetical protein
VANTANINNGNITQPPDVSNSNIEPQYLIYLFIA